MQAHSRSVWNMDGCIWSCGMIPDLAARSCRMLLRQGLGSRRGGLGEPTGLAFCLKHDSATGSLLALSRAWKTDRSSTTNNVD